MFESIAALLCDQFAARIVKQLDGPDERYWDLELSGEIVTLHCQHYLGITLEAGSDRGELLVANLGGFLGAKVQ